MSNLDSSEGITFVEVAQETVAQKALRLLSEVPAEDFIVSFYTDKESKCCALGHWERLNSEDPSDYSYENCVEGAMWSDLRRASVKFFNDKHACTNNCSLSEVNNFEEGNFSLEYYPERNTLLASLYPQKEIKDRVIACLNDMVAAGF